MEVIYFLQVDGAPNATRFHGADGAVWDRWWSLEE
jgi:hypothetical protein